MHHFQTLALVVCCTALVVEGASVVRVPRVYNILIKSDGALAPSEAVSADADIKNGGGGDAAASGEADDPSLADEEREEGDAAEGSDDPPQEPLPILNAKEGAVQEGVNYTQVPLSRAYPLTRYTAPIIATHYPFPYLHGGLILGPVPKFAPAQQREQEVASADYGQTEELEEETLRRQEEIRPIQQLPLPQYSRRAQYAQAPNAQYAQAQQQQQQQPSAFRQRSVLPQGAYEDDDNDSVRVEAQDEEEEEEV